MAKGKTQKDLPGMENRQIEELHNKAIELEAVRSERMKLTAKEKTLSDELIALGKQYGKQQSGYNCEGVEVEFVPGEMKVKVRVQKAESECQETQSQTGGQNETEQPESGVAPPPPESSEARSARMKEYWAKRRAKETDRSTESVQ